MGGRPKLFLYVFSPQEALPLYGKDIVIDSIVALCHTSQQKKICDDNLIQRNFLRTCARSYTPRSIDHLTYFLLASSSFFKGAVSPSPEMKMTGCKYQEYAARAASKVKRISKVSNYFGKPVYVVLLKGKECIMP